MENNDVFQGKDFIGGRGYESKPIYIADMGRCTPAGSLSDAARPGRWRTMSYETEHGAGVMLLAGPETAAPEVTCSLGRNGWHAISVGVLGDGRQSTRVLARLSGEDTSSIITLPPVPRTGHGEPIREMYWKTADISGQDLVLGQFQYRVSTGEGPGSMHCEAARIAYVKLTPLTSSEAEALQRDREDSSNKRLFAHNDAHGPHFGFRPTNEEEIRRHVIPYADNDFSRLYWETGGGDMAFYHSKIATIPSYDGLDDFGRQGDRMQAESWRIMRDKGIDPLAVAVERAHEIGLEIHASFRLAGFRYPPPLDHFNMGTSFFMHHPELRSIDKDGNVTPRISYAYPKTRQFIISLLTEMVGYGVDGVGLLYNRRPPLLEYEPPIVDGFKAEYGEDPRELPDDDPRWLRYRARTLTQFMHEVRRAMDDAAERMGRTERLGITAITMKDEQENLINGMDVEAWVNEGVVDTLIPYTSAPNLSGMAAGWTNPDDAKWFMDITRGKPVTLALNLMPRYISPEDYRRRAAALYDAGIENLFFWDSDASNRAHYAEDWDALRRLGHREELKAWMEAGEPSLALPTVGLKVLGGWNLSYATPG